jgi:hypothetical protein
MSADSATIELDLPTLQQLDLLARRWGLSREETAAKVIAEADKVPRPAINKSKPDILRELQQRLKMTPQKAAAWQESIRDGRR